MELNVTFSVCFSCHLLNSKSSHIFRYYRFSCWHFLFILFVYPPCVDLLTQIFVRFYFLFICIFFCRRFRTMRWWSFKLNVQCAIIKERKKEHENWPTNHKSSTESHSNWDAFCACGSFYGRHFMLDDLRSNCNLHRSENTMKRCGGIQLQAPSDIPLFILASENGLFEYFNVDHKRLHVMYNFTRFMSVAF